MNLLIISSFLFASSFMFLIVPYLRRLAIRLSLIDSPTEARKIHKQSVPVIGGISIFLSLAISMSMLWYFIPKADYELVLVISSSITLLILGIIDDKIAVNPFLKLAIQIFCVGLLLSSGMANHLFLLGLDNPWLFTSQYIFLLLLFVGIINAFNLIDGVDGLAGALFLLGFLWLGIHSFYLQNTIIQFISLVVAGSIITFLHFNFSQHQKIFLGDGGSLFLGSLMIGLMIMMPEQSPKEEVYLSQSFYLGLIAIAGLPILDTLVVFKNRIVNGKSPFYPDKTHLHHRILRHVKSHKTVTQILTILTCCTLVVSLLLSLKLPFLVCCIAILCFYGGLYMVLNTVQKFKSHQDILYKIEKNANGHAY